MISIKDIRHSYDGQRQFRFPDFALGEGEHLLLLGQSGCGKTTLLHILGGILLPKAGRVRVAGTEMTQLPPTRLDKFRGRHIGMVFQKTHFVRSLTVMENLALCQRLAGRKEDRAAIQRTLDQLNIGHKANERTRHLSQGEQQRTAIARALVNQPRVILADEPTSALDDANTGEVIALLEKQAAERNATLIIVTHDNRLKDRFQNRIEL